MRQRSRNRPGGCPTIPKSCSWMKPFGALDEFTRQEMNEGADAALARAKRGTILFVGRTTFPGSFVPVRCRCRHVAFARSSAGGDRSRPAAPEAAVDTLRSGNSSANFAALEEVIRDRLTSSGAETAERSASADAGPEGAFALAAEDGRLSEYLPPILLFVAVGAAWEAAVAVSSRSPNFFCRLLERHPVRAS